MVRHALTMMSGTLASRVLGLAREIVTAALFGATAGLDAFLVAYALSNMARQMLAEGALSASFVPVFTRLVASERKEEAARLARQICTLLSLAGGAVVLAGIICAPWLTRLMAPGFEGETFAAAVRQTRQLFPFLLLVSWAALAMGALNSLGRFLTSSLAPALSNLIYIVVALALAPRLGLAALVVAVLAGGVAQLGLQVYWLYRSEGMSLLPAKPDFQNPALRQALALFVPFALGLSINQLNPLLTRAFGSFLTEGSISVLNYSNRVIQLPLGLVVIAISQALLPELSRLSKGDEFIALLRSALAFTAFLVLPLTVGTMLVAGPVVHLLFVRGAFGLAAWQGTATTLFWSALGLPAMAASTVALRALYALEMRRAPLLVAGSNVVALFFACLVLSPLWGVDGLALGGTIAFAVSAGLSLILVWRKTGFAPWPSLRVLGGLALATGVMGLVCGLLIVWWPYSPSASLTARCGWLAAVGGLGALVYGFVSFFTCKEAWRQLRS